MEIETKYLAPRADAFVALMQTPALGGFHLEPLAPVDVRDVYLDTAGADLLRQGYVFRIREQGKTGRRQEGEVVATLKGLGGAEGPLHRRLELEAPLDVPLRNGRIPPRPGGPLGEALGRLVGEAPLGALARLHQYRTPRVVFDGTRLTSVLSLDVVAHETPSGLHVSNEVEVELADGGREEDLYRLDPALRARGLEPAARTKFERALLRLHRAPDAPILLLPDERAALDRFAETSTPRHRRCARVVLLTARGLDADTVAPMVGLSAARVQHWIEAFRERRLSLFDTGPDPALLERRPVASYRISELVMGGAPMPLLFGPAHVEEPTAPAAELVPASIPSADEWAGGDGNPGVAKIPQEETGEPGCPPVSMPARTTTGDGASTSPPEPTAAPQEVVEASDAEAPEEAAAEESSADAAETPAVETAVLGTAAGARPVLRADEPVLAAAERVLRHARDYLVGATARLVDERDPTSVRRVLVAAHRVRIALELFGTYLPLQSSRRLHGGLRTAARDLDALGDLDFALAHVAAAREEGTADERAAFTPVLRTLDAEREAALEAAVAQLQGAAHARWLARFERLLRHLRAQVAGGILAGDHEREQSDDYLDEDPERPVRDRLRHMLGSALWDRYEALRAYDAVAGGSPEGVSSEAPLYPLGVACAAMQYVLGLAAGCASEAVGTGARTLAAVEHHLVVLHHARRAAEALAPFADAPPVRALRVRLEALAATARSEVPAHWAAVAGMPFREALARVVVAVGAA